MNIALIFAGGIGQRLNDNKNVVPKQFLKINEKPILVHTLLHFQKHKEIDKIYVVILPEYREYTKKLIMEFALEKVASLVDGGSSAQDSIYNGLKKIAADNQADDIVLIHDGVRPVVSSEVISNTIASVKQYGTGITATPCYETILVSPDGIKPTAVPYRKETFVAQAPQGFLLGEIFSAHEEVRNSKNGYKDIVDSCTLFHSLGKETHLVKGNFGNIKITTPQDVYILKGMLNYLNAIENGEFITLYEQDKQEILGDNGDVRS